MIVIVYTTLYRQGGHQFVRVAETMKSEKELHGKVLCAPIESKRELKKIFHDLIQQHQQIEEFHFIGHAGMYGPMYGTVEYPEQFSPHEWKTLSIPFAPHASAYFHCCRSARWFANFFAQTFQIPTYGYHWYTTFSASKEKFKRDRDSNGPLYSIGCPGKKSHGLKGSLKKYSGFQPAEQLKRFDPHPKEDRSYDKVASLYDAVFQDIKVREDEWNWLSQQLGALDGKTVLDIGCGNGALLQELCPQAERCIGVDASRELLNHAVANHQDNKNVSFHHITGPLLPLEDQSVDLAISLLSFRYLDWDPMMRELERVLQPEGRILIVDMVAVPPRLKEYPFLLQSKWKHYRHRKKYPEYWKALSKLVAHPDWKQMLHYNPIRSEHEMKWYLESRFPHQKVETINIGYHSRVIAFNSGPIQNGTQLELTYP